MMLEVESASEGDSEEAERLVIDLDDNEKARMGVKERRGSRMSPEITKPDGMYDARPTS